MKLDSDRAATARGDRAIRDFAYMVCKGYSSLVYSQYTSYRDRLNAVLADGQLKGAYLGGLCFFVFKNGICYI